MDQELIAGLIQTHSDSEARSHLLKQFGAIDRASIQLLKLEIDRLQRTDPQIALKAAETTLRICTSTDDPACTALSWWAKANSLRELGQYSEALSCYDNASQIFTKGGNRVEAAKTQIGKIDALMYLSKYDEASLEANRARRLLLKHDEPIQAAKLDANMGNLFHRIDRYGLALQRYSRARRVFSRLGEDLLVAQVDVNRANVFTLLDRFSPAQRAYERARARFESRGLTATVAMIDANLGFVFQQRGRYSRALELYVSSTEAFRQLGMEKNAAVVDLDLAFLYLDLNMPTECLGLCDNALSCFAQLGMRAEQANALTAKALSLTRFGQHSLASGLLAEARALHESEGNEVRAASTDLRRAMLSLQSYSGGSSLDESMELVRRADEVLQRNGIPGKMGLAALVRGQIHALAGQPDLAVEPFGEATAIAKKFGLPWLAHQAFHAHGRLLENAEPQKARLLYEKAIHVLESMRGELRSENARAFFLGDKLQVYQDLVLLLLGAGSESASEAFEYVERAKSRALVDLLRGELEIRAKNEADQSLLKRIKTLQEELNWYYGRLDDGEAKGHRLSSQRMEHIADEVRTRERLLAQYVEQLQISSPEYPGLSGASIPSLEEIQATLADDEALVEYYVARKEVLVFVVTRNALHVRRGIASHASVSALARRLAFQLSKFNYGEGYVHDHFLQLLAGAEDCLTGLYQELLRPIEPWIEDRNIVFVPHGGLHALPFHAFSDGERYVVERQGVSYSPSAAVLKYCAHKSPTSLRRCLLVGVPDERAPQVESEVEDIRQLFFRPRCLVGPEATASALQEQASHRDVVHIATHALFSPGSPMFSRLKLADGWLNVYDIYNLRLDASLVTLSSCQTGVGRIVGSDEIIGLARGFLYAGAASLLASLWAVNDSSTASLMKTFYRNLTQGKSKRDSLRKAQLEMLAEYRHPYYWAPFVLIGRSC